jgi:hypothetical protein
MRATFNRGKCFVLILAKKGWAKVGQFFINSSGHRALRQFYIEVCIRLTMLSAYCTEPHSCHDGVAIRYLITRTNFSLK